MVGEDRRVLIRLAASMPKGSEERRALLRLASPYSRRDLQALKRAEKFFVQGLSELDKVADSIFDAWVEGGYKVTPDSLEPTRRVLANAILGYRNWVRKAL